MSAGSRCWRCEGPLLRDKERRDAYVCLHCGASTGDESWRKFTGAPPPAVPVGKRRRDK